MIILILLSFILLPDVFGQTPKKNNYVHENNVNINLSIYTNYNLSGFEWDAFYNTKSRKGYFIDLSFNSDFDSSMTIHSLFGLLQNYKDTFIGGGYSNFLLASDTMLNELFVLFKHRFITNLFFLGLSDEILPNYLGILDINHFIRNLPLEASMIANISTELGITGCDISFTVANQISKRLSFGYTLSNERYEGSRNIKQTYMDKSGNVQTKEFSRDFVDRGFFNSIFLGYVF